MLDTAQAIAGFSSHQAGLLAVLLLPGLSLLWRSAGPPERASILTLIGLVMMDWFIWWLGSGMALLHFAADTLAFSWILRVALRAARLYPAVIAAALLLAVLTQLLLLVGLAVNPSSVAILVNGLHILAILALLCGSLNHRKIVTGGRNRPAWRNRLSQG